MPSVSCPKCGEKGRIPSQFVGNRIKCAKCGNSFTVTAPVPKAVATAAAVSPSQSALHGEFIPVEGLDEGGWLSTEVAPTEPQTGLEQPAKPEREEVPAEFTAFQAGDAPGPKQYKVLTRKDPWFGGKFDLTRLEEALNYYARQGWVFRSMAMPHIAGYSGDAKEELVILMER